MGARRWITQDDNGVGLGKAFRANPPSRRQKPVLAGDHDLSAITQHNLVQILYGAHF